ncbi:hypothetical protein D0Z00_000695 [Geotrichum galactomycetum]|uniref:Uncharacterized protein n=1 Tax=Geotrichum galactomycetum TaxID=27317 RepID=A0ACB6V984_9ASCO|nr:hypothetical protein D0Z00_000695 [Geotrichum candidum]
MIILGLTGGIATGKSTVSTRLRTQHNLTIVDADIIARMVVEPGTTAYKKIVAHFGPTTPDLLHDDGSLNRPALGRAVFGNEPERLFLNSVVHPAVRKEMLKQAIMAYIRGSDIVVLDIPLLFESKLDRFCTTTVVVSCNEEQELARLLARDSHLTEEDARKRIASQMALEEKRTRAGHVIDNSGTLDELYAQIDDLVAKVRPSPVTNFATWLGPPVVTGVALIALLFQQLRPKL